MTLIMSVSTLNHDLNTEIRSTLYQWGNGGLMRDTPDDHLVERVLISNCNKGNYNMTMAFRS